MAKQPHSSSKSSSTRTNKPAQKAVRYTPAAWVIMQFGSAIFLAEALGLKPSTVYRWTYPPDERSRGTDGRIPGNKQEAVLRAAKARGLDIRAVDLVEGRVA